MSAEKCKIWAQQVSGAHQLADELCQLCLRLSHSLPSLLDLQQSNQGFCSIHTTALDMNVAGLAEHARA